MVVCLVVKTYAWSVSWGLWVGCSGFSLLIQCDVLGCIYLCFFICFHGVLLVCLFWAMMALIIVCIVVVLCLSVCWSWFHRDVSMCVRMLASVFLYVFEYLSDSRVLRGLMVIMFQYLLLSHSLAALF